MICANTEPVLGKHASLAAAPAPRRTNLDELALQIRVLHVRRRQEDEHERHQLVLGRRLEHLRSESVVKRSAVRTVQRRRRARARASENDEPQAHLDVKLRNSVMSSIRNSGSMRKISGVSSGRGRLRANSTDSKSVHRRCQTAPNPGKTRGNARSLDPNMRVLLLRVDESHKPGHDQVGETRALGEVVGIKELDLVREVVTAPLLDFFLSSQGRRSSLGQSRLLAKPALVFPLSPCSGQFLLVLLLLAGSVIPGKMGC